MVMETVALYHSASNGGQTGYTVFPSLSTTNPSGPVSSGPFSYKIDTIVNNHRISST